MITKVEISGYKSFEDFSIEFGPFSVIAGLNGVGKSNLFDAIRHLGRLASLSLREAFETERGSLEDLFTSYPDGSRAKRIDYAVELLIPPSIVDQFSSVVELKFLRLRYELSIGLSVNDNRLELYHERLISIKRNEDQFLLKYKNVRNSLPKLTGGRNAFIDSDIDENDHSIITISQDGRAGNKRTVSAEGAFRTIMSSITTVEFPHVFAVRSMLENTHFLQLNPDKLRQSSSYRSPLIISSDGEYMARALARLKIDDVKALKMISNDLSSIVPGVQYLNVDFDDKKQEYFIFITHVDGYNIRAKQLSDGTLRILALLIVRYDNQFNGIIILEEPENGVHPGRIPQVIRLLRSMSNIKNYPKSMKQVIINTHSAKVLEKVPNEEIAMAYTKKRVKKERGAYSITDITYVSEEIFSNKEHNIAFYELKKILDEKVSEEKGL